MLRSNKSDWSNVIDSFSNYPRKFALPFQMPSMHSYIKPKGFRKSSNQCVRLITVLTLIAESETRKPRILSKKSFDSGKKKKLLPSNRKCLM